MEMLVTLPTLLSYPDPPVPRSTGLEDDITECMLFQLPEVLPATPGHAALSKDSPALHVSTAPKARLGTLLVYDDGSLGLRIGDVGECRRWGR